MKKYLFILCLTFAIQVDCQRTITYPPLLEDHIVNNYQDNVYLDRPPISEFGSLEDLVILITDGNEEDFELSKVLFSYMDPNKKILKFNHVVNGISVEGSGFSVVVEVDGGNSEYGIGGSCQTCPPVDPCDLVYSITPFIVNVNEMTPPIIDYHAIETLIDSDSLYNVSEEYVNYIDKSIASLAYKVDYTKGGNKIAWIDVTSNQIINNRDAGMLLNAPVQDYGDQNNEVFLIDETNGGLTSLENSDIKTYDFSDQEFWEFFDNAELSDFTSSRIPTTVSNKWSLSDAPATVFQAHFVATKCVDAYLSHLNMDFEEVNVAANLMEGMDISTAGLPLHFDPTFEESHVVVGNNNGNSLAVFDIMAHELGHVALYELGLSYDVEQAQVIHEAVSDMFGVYIASKITGNIEWELGLDVPLSLGRRNLQNPVYSAIINTTAWFNMDDPHSMGQPIAHLFYLLSEGHYDPSVGTIDALGLDETMFLFIDAIAQLGSEATLLELLDKTIELADEQYGLCPGGVSVRNAWDFITDDHNINPNFPDPTNGFAEFSDRANDMENYSCNINIIGNKVVCEENETLYLCAQGGVPGDIFEWTILHGSGPQFTANDPATQTGNSFVGDCLAINEFPDFNFYPQTIKVRVTSSFSNINKLFNIRIDDCNGDDPTCSEYYQSLNGLSTNNSNNNIEHLTLELYNNSNSTDENLVSNVIIYDMLGHIVHKFDTSNIYTFERTGIYIIVSEFSNGEFRVEKRFFYKNQNTSNETIFR